MPIGSGDAVGFRTPASAASTILVLLLAGWAIAWTAWLCDDAYISFRVVDNLVSGFGMRWNVDERVQAFSNPLWVLLLAPAYALTSDIYHTSLAISVILSLATVWVVARGCTNNPLIGALAALGLVLSPIFIEFSTSGLENPLSHLLVALFCATYFREGTRLQRRAFLLSLIASLAAVNRLDNLILLGVPAGIFLWKHRSMPVLRAAALGATPLIAWEAFSLVYYGFLIPNTAYAKLATDIPKSALIAQGLTYLGVSAAFDPAGAFMLVCAFLAGALIHRPMFAIVLGICAQIAFVVFVGGDFMVGRFLSTSIVAAAAIVASGLSLLQRERRRWAAAAMLTGVGIAGMFTAPLTIASSSAAIVEKDVAFPEHGIIDERKYYYWATGWGSPHRSGVPEHPWGALGRDLQAAKTRTFEYHVIGFLGFNAGPQVHVIDQNALADPLLARLPARSPWRIGHFPRDVPPGYFETVDSNVNRLADPDLARMYDALVTVTRGPLFSVDRWKAIVSLNVGEAAGLGRRSLYAARVACVNRHGDRAPACMAD